MYEDFFTKETSPAIPLWPSGSIPFFDPELGQNEPALHPYIVPGRPDAGCVVICAGGAYMRKAYHEGEPVALKLNSLGLHAVVVDYRVEPYRHPVPLLDAQRAIRTVRHRAGELGVNPEKVAILGFSAGGHLASTAWTHYDDGQPGAQDPVERMSCRPDAALLCYAVISMVSWQHLRSCEALLGDKLDVATRRELSAELNIRPELPPVFLWHTAADQSVPVMNSLAVAEECYKKGVAFALHVYPSGPHGIGLAVKDERHEPVPQAQSWPDDAARFLRDLGF